jgi:hypothetical protein
MFARGDGARKDGPGGLPHQDLSQTKCKQMFRFYLGYALLLFNGLITFAGLWMIRIRE